MASTAAGCQAEEVDVVATHPVDRRDQRYPGGRRKVGGDAGERRRDVAGDAFDRRVEAGGQHVDDDPRGKGTGRRARRADGDGRPAFSDAPGGAMFFPPEVVTLPFTVGDQVLVAAVHVPVGGLGAADDPGAAGCTATEQPEIPAMAAKPNTKSECRTGATCLPPPRSPGWVAADTVRPG